MKTNYDKLIEYLHLLVAFSSQPMQNRGAEDNGSKGLQPTAKL